MDPSLLKFVLVPFPKMESELKKGTVDAVVAVEPFVTLAQNSGTARVLIRSVHAAYGERFMIGSWFGKKSWANENPESSQAFIRAINRATAFVEKHPDVSAYFLVNNTKLTRALLEQISVPAFSTRFDSSDMQHMIELAHKYGFINQSFPADVFLLKDYYPLSHNLYRV